MQGSEFYLFLELRDLEASYSYPPYFTASTLTLSSTILVLWQPERPFQNWNSQIMHFPRAPVKCKFLTKFTRSPLKCTPASLHHTPDLLAHHSPWPAFPQTLQAYSTSGPLHLLFPLIWTLLPQLARCFAPWLSSALYSVTQMYSHQAVPCPHGLA